MGSQYETATDDWAYRTTGVVSAGYSGGGTIVGVDLYSQKTGFLGHARFYGLGVDIGAGANVELTDWIWLDCSHAFSPRELHGSRGSVKGFTVGVVAGTATIFGTAHKKKSPDYLFDDAYIGNMGAGLGLNFSYCWGTWYITSCRSEVLPPNML